MPGLHQYLNYPSKVCLGFYSKSLAQSSLCNQHLLHCRLPILHHRRHFKLFGLEISCPLKFNLTVIFNLFKKPDAKQRHGKRDVYLVEDHSKFNKAVERKSLVGKLSRTIQAMDKNKTKVVYVYGLPGIGKKELVRQFALNHYKNLPRKKKPKKFVAMIDASDPNSFHQDLFKIAEQADVIENYGEYLNRTSKPEGYVDILSVISSRLKDRSDWLLVFKDIKLDENLRWLVGEILPENEDLVRKIQTVDLHKFLPQPNDPSNGTILLTTCDSYACRHYTTNVKHFHMPNGMEDKEALELLEDVSGCKQLQKCGPVKKLMQQLGYAPSSIYWYVTAVCMSGKFFPVTYFEL